MEEAEAEAEAEAESGPKPTAEGAEPSPDGEGTKLEAAQKELKRLVDEVEARREKIKWYLAGTTNEMEKKTPTGLPYPMATKPTQYMAQVIPPALSSSAVSGSVSPILFPGFPRLLFVLARTALTKDHLSGGGDARLAGLRPNAHR